MEKRDGAVVLDLKSFLNKKKSRCKIINYENYLCYKLIDQNCIIGGGNFAFLILYGFGVIYRVAVSRVAIEIMCPAGVV